MTQKVGETREQYNLRRRELYACSASERLRIARERCKSYRKHRENRIANARAYRLAHPESHTLSNRRKRGIAHLVGAERRSGICPICKKFGPLVPDHNHKKGTL